MFFLPRALPDLSLFVTWIRVLIRDLVTKDPSYLMLPHPPLENAPACLCLVSHVP